MTIILIIFTIINTVGVIFLLMLHYGPSMSIAYPTIYIGRSVWLKRIEHVGLWWTVRYPRGSHSKRLITFFSRGELKNEFELYRNLKNHLEES